MAGEFLRVVGGLIRDRKILWQLARAEIRHKYMGSALGFSWAFVLPVANIAIIAFVFQVGFRAGKTADNIDFVPWLMAGMIPWFFFSESVSDATQAILGQSRLVKQMVFNVALLPVARILAAVVVHLVFLVALFVILALYGLWPGLYALQLIYYLTGMCLLLVGLSWLTSSLVVFFRDLGQIITIGLQLLFWLTPIFWTTHLLPKSYPVIGKLLKLNPIYYVTEGYRNSLIGEKFFLSGPLLWTCYFWAVTVLILVLGATLFGRLRPHFADVL